MSDPGVKPDEKNHSSVALVNNELAIGDDRDFERTWWRLEISIWIVLGIYILCGLVGALGRGKLSHRSLSSADGSLQIRYERVARNKTPAALQVTISPPLFRGDRAYLWANRGIIDALGTQRIVPQPDESLVGKDGVAYLFHVEDINRPIAISFALEPQSPGVAHGEVRIDPAHDLYLRTITLP